MKNNKLLLFSALLAGSFLYFAHNHINSIPNNKTGVQNKKSESKEEAKGSAKWLFDMQKNPLTGIVDPMDVLKAKDELYQMYSNRSSTSALGLEWEELGPDNIGGRTRAILFDKNNPDKIFAGSVSGGLWVSTNGGSNWNVVPGFDQQPNLGIVSLAQASNGDIYAGTGEGDFYYYNGTGSAGILGAGIYKSTDGGNSFSRLSSTIPTTLNSSGASAATAFCSVHELAVSPNNPNRIYAATKFGLRSSNDGGQSWNHPVRSSNGTANTTVSLDVDVATDGTVIANINNRLYRSTTGDSGSFSLVTAGLPASGISRIEFAISPSDPNYMYALAGKSSNGLLLGVYQSIDKGQNWSTIGSGGSSQFEMFGTGQSDYDIAIAVFPGDKTRIIVGGVVLWEWKQTNPQVAGIGQWKAINDNNAGEQSPFYVHSDIHDFKFHPTNPSVVYIGCDGGIFKGYDNLNNAPFIYFQAMNNGYNVTQYYSIAFEGDDPSRKGFIAGAQDNGTNYVSGNGNTTKSAEKISGGDGAECEISYLSPNVSFSTIYYGSLARHTSKGGSGTSFYPDNFSTLFPTLGDAGFASFVTPIALYETKTAANSPDFYQFINEKASKSLGSGNGVNKHYTGTITLPYPSGTIQPDSILFNAGLLNVTDNGNGLLIGDVDGSQSNTINYITGAYDFYFNTAPTNQAPINLTFDIVYAAGSTINVVRADFADPLSFTLVSQINPGDTLSVYDPFQAKLAVGFSGSNGVWMTKEPLSFSGTPEWMKLGIVAGTSEELAWSEDGDVLYVGTDNGSLYRFSNLAAVTGIANGDMSSPNSIVVSTQIAGFGGNFITGLSVDPTDANKLAVSLGGYGTGTPTHVYYSTTAASCSSSSATANFSGKQGASTTKLPAMPIYSVLIEKNDPKRVILGTESGVFSTANITVANPVWTSENGVSGLLPNVPVFKIRQQRRAGDQVYNPYVIYAGTHGRGAWKSESYLGSISVGIKENKDNLSNALVNNALSVFPNPMRELGTIAFNIPTSLDGSVSPNGVLISFYSMEGKLVKTIKTGKLSAGQQKIQFSTEELLKGTYIISVDGGNVRETSKFVVLK